MNFTLHNVLLETLSALMLIVLIACQLTSRDRHTRLSRLFLLVLCLHTAVLLLDAFAWATDWIAFAPIYHFSRIANYLVYSLSFFDIIALLIYIAESIPLDRAAKRTVGWIAGVLTVLYHALMIVSQFTGSVYYVTPDNEFLIGPLFFVPHAFGCVVLLLIFTIVMRNRKKLGRRDTATFAAYVLIPAAALLINIVVYYLMLLYAAMALALLVIFVNIQMQREKQLKEKELELMESQIAIMLSQIQPHFLYNALFSISKLCDIDAAVAKESVLDFGQYLRGNLDSLSVKAPIPLTEELRHVRTYLSLEKKRFDERLAVVYDIRATDFALPALSLQPLVENAVRYGVTKRREGGTVTIRTDETPDSWQVSVLDDGVGFDPGQVSQDGRSHVGIENVRKRLEMMCGGTLEIDTAPGVGTRATIKLPKERH